jgi:enolase-phosphatase E1
MTLRLTAHTVVLDIEGTTSAAGFILGDLYDYARPRLAEWIDGHAGEPEVARAVAQARTDGGLAPTASTAEVVAVLKDWMDHDLKATPLKTIQGLIWADGFERGELRSHFFADVIPRLRAWHAAGIRLAVFSSGSVTSQRSWFRHAPGGDLTPLIHGYFDTVSAGPKKVESSYQTIAATLEAQPGRLLFLTDHPDELAAARRAAWQAVAVRRAGEPHQGSDFRGAPEIDSFDALEVVAP